MKNFYPTTLIQYLNTQIMSNKTSHEDTFYVEGMLKNDPFIVNRIYKEFYPGIRRMVTSNSGNADRAWDVFQDTLVVIFKMAQSPDFVLTCPFYNLLYPISKRVWLKELSKKSRSEVTIQDEDGYIDETNVEETIHQMERHALYKEKFVLLGEKCQALMKLVFDKKKMREIAVLLNHKNAHTTRQQHYKCRKKLTNLIQQDPKYKELKR